jgi:Protein of unknown function (DUF2798)
MDFQEVVSSGSNHTEHAACAHPVDPARDQHAKRYLTVKKLPERYTRLVMLLILSVMMTFIVSAVSTWPSIGFVPGFNSIWMSAWGLSWMIGFPTLLLVLPLVRRLVPVVVETSARS